MQNTAYHEPLHLSNVTIPGQAEFIKAMESKIGNLLGSKLTGQFKMLVAPDGFHYGFKYGNNGYYNINSLADIDRTLIVDPSTNQLGFGIRPCSVLYREILHNTSFHYSTSDQNKMNQADIIAQAYTDAVISAFKNDFPNVPLTPDASAIATIFEYITTTFGSIEQVPIYYTKTKNALSDYSSHATESYQMHSRISDAQKRLQCLMNNVDKPSLNNGGLQTDAANYYVGYRLPDFAQTYASLTTETNKIDILLEFDHFDKDSSQLSIDHTAAFLIPTPICVFGTSETKYTMNSLVTSQSTVSMQMSFKGITTLSPSPVSANATAHTGWYDETILSEIVRNTDKDLTGYCLINSEFDVKTLFGPNGTFSRLKEFVICQAPIITLTMTEVDTQSISTLFQHNSKLDVDFFGFGISSSTHSYTVQTVTVDSQSRTATITLGAPKPSATVSVETEVAYVLGGVPSYPPSNAVHTTEKILPFTFQLPNTENSVLNSIPVFRNQLKLLPGSHTYTYYLGKTPSFFNSDEDNDAILSIWYYYLPAENTIWLSDAHDSTSDKTKITFYNRDGRVENVLTNHSCTDLPIVENLNTFMEDLIRTAEDQGLCVVRRRDIPDNMKGLYYYQGNQKYNTLGSTFFGTRNIYHNNVFANATNTSHDIFIDPAGTPCYNSWIDLWEFCTMQHATNCVNCLSNGDLCGAHVLMGAAGAADPAAGAQVDILPLCYSCNNWHNVGAMHAAFNTMSLVMIW